MSEDEPISHSLLKLEGFLDAVDDGFVYGWAFDSSRPLERVQVEVLVDGERVASGVAEGYRADLDRLKKGDGCCAFRFELPYNVLEGAARNLRVVYRATGEDLFGSTQSLELNACSAVTKLSEFAGGVGYKSRFGGLWTDLEKAEYLIAGKRALGWISEEESVLLSSWVRDGFVIIPNAIPTR